MYWLARFARLSMRLLARFARLSMHLLARLTRPTLMIASYFKCLTVSNRMSLFKA
jgi:hypothetical protein